MIGPIAAFVLPLIAMFVIGIGLWGLGRGLRRCGYGERLDKIHVGVTAAQQRVRSVCAERLRGRLKRLPD